MLTSQVHHCFHKGDLAFRVGGLHIFGGGRLANESRFDYWINLLGALPSPEVQATKDFPMQNKLVKSTTTPTLAIDWANMGAPRLDKRFWLDLTDALLSIKNARILVSCEAGHGRTGTALAILAVLMGACKTGCPVTFIRKSYCKQAVESDTQVSYIQTITGRIVTAGSSNRRIWWSSPL